MIHVKYTVIFQLPKFGIWFKSGLVLLNYSINLSMYQTYSRRYISRRTPHLQMHQILSFLF